MIAALVPAAALIAALATGVAGAAPSGRIAGEVFRDCADCPEMVVLPTGQFELGTPRRLQVPTEIPAELQPLRIRITQPIAMGRYEITRAEYRQFALESGRDRQLLRCRAWVEAKQAFRDIQTTWDRPNLPAVPGDRHPATCIDWHDAVEYARWLSQRSGQRYRLPAEVEWEYAAKAGSNTLRPWGNAADRGCAYANSNDRATAARYPLAWTLAECNDGFADIAPVGSLKPNAFGLFDMIGNVWEWAEDCASLSYFGRPVDQRAWIWDGGCRRRVQRGGGWITGPERSRSAFHGDGDAEDRAEFAGFRVVRELAGDDSAPAPAAAFAPTMAGAHRAARAEQSALAGQILRDCPLCPELVVVPSGSFSMGTASDAYEHDVATGETPPLAVEIRKPFALGRFEVTRAQFQAVLAAGGGESIATDCDVDASAPPASPITCVPPAAIERFLTALNAASGQHYRLPSESEWEFAARAGAAGARYWSARDSHEGVSISRACDLANVYDVSARALSLPQPHARCADGYVHLAPVGSFLPNTFGLYDMVGNARELTADCFTTSYKGRPADERAWLWSGCAYRSARGGSYRSRPLQSRSAAREFVSGAAQPGELHDLGFRVARDLGAAEVTRTAAP